jgi:hypothetical protein
MSPEDFLGTLIHHTWLDYAALLGRWAYAAGRDVLDPVPYGAQHQGCAVRDMLTRIGGPDIGDLQWDGQWRARSLPVPAIQILRQLDLYPLQASTRAVLRQQTVEGVAKAGLAASGPFSCSVSSRTASWREVLDQNTIPKLVAFYREDFTDYGYEVPIST